MYEDDWTDVLSYLQAESNNVKQFTTGYAPNELVYGFKVNDFASMLADLLPVRTRSLAPFLVRCICYGFGLA